MTTHLLFPHRFRPIGWVIFMPSALLGFACMYADFKWHVLDVALPAWLTKIGLSDSLFGNNNNLTDELAALGVITGLILIAFSKEKTEDEMMGQLRLEALQWSVYANYLVLAITIITVYDMAFFNVMVYNMFTMLLVFIGRFRWLIYRNNQLMAA